MTPEKMGRLIAGLHHTAAEHEPQFLKVEKTGSNLDALEQVFKRP